MIRKNFFTSSFTLCLLSSLFLAQIPAQETSFSGSLTAQAGVGLPQTHENKGHFLLGTTVFDGTVKSYMGESMMVVNSQLIYDALGAQSSNGTEALVSEDASFALKLKEAYFDYNGGSWALRAGRQIAAWGKADSIQVADILCPQDSSVMIAANYKESRLGIDALRLSYILDFLQLDAYWIPFFTPSTLPLAKGNPLNPIHFPKSFGDMPVSSPKSMSAFDLPEKKLSNSEYALRLGVNLSSLDFSLYGFYGWEDTPFFAYSSDGSTINLKGSYERLMMFGADSAIPLGNFVFRFEAAYFPERYLQTSAEYQKSRLTSGLNSESTKRRHQLVGLLGFDWDAGSGLNIMAQYVGDAIFDGVKELDRKAYTHLATLTLEKSLMNELLSLTLHGELDLCEFSSLINAETEYSLTDSVKLGLIGNFFFEGKDDENGEYGIYRDLSCITLKGKISF